MKAIIPAVLLLAGCAATPADEEQREYARVDERARAIARYDALVEACRAAGGNIYMDRSWGAFPPSLSDIESATCARPLPRVRR